MAVTVAAAGAMLLTACGGHEAGAGKPKAAASKSAKAKSLTTVGDDVPTAFVPSCPGAVCFTKLSFTIPEPVNQSVTEGALTANELNFRILDMEKDAKFPDQSPLGGHVAGIVNDSDRCLNLFPDVNLGVAGGGHKIVMGPHSKVDIGSTDNIVKSANTYPPNSSTGFCDDGVVAGGVAPDSPASVSTANPGQPANGESDGKLVREAPDLQPVSVVDLVREKSMNVDNNEVIEDMKPGIGGQECITNRVCLYSEGQFFANDDPGKFSSVALKKATPDFGRLGVSEDGKDKGMQDIASSIVNATTDEWCFYTDNDMQGKELRLAPGHALTGLAEFDNMISSAQACLN
ncbi:peptidase inhibitor family I36 protein [Streptomyces flaveolus]|uniref:peptidase inhibitor family I36 protein n=1 Tax=Streptomyces flaveolus TaxID=67297 RepID=UPI0033FFFD06